MADHQPRPSRLPVCPGLPSLHLPLPGWGGVPVTPVDAEPGENKIIHELKQEALVRKNIVNIVKFELTFTVISLFPAG